VKIAGLEGMTVRKLARFHLQFVIQKGTIACLARQSFQPAQECPLVFELGHEPAFFSPELTR
jgi:hypothetical protein